MSYSRARRSKCGLHVRPDRASDEAAEIRKFTGSENRKAKNFRKSEIEKWRRKCSKTPEKWWKLCQNGEIKAGLPLFFWGGGWFTTTFSDFLDRFLQFFLTFFMRGWTNCVNLWIQKPGKLKNFQKSEIENIDGNA